MLKLSQGRRQMESVGEPLLMPFRVNQNSDPYAQRMVLRKGQLAMIAAPPGVGKSMLIQYALQHGDRKGNVNHGIYLSADSDSFTMFTRGASFASGFDQVRIENDVRDTEFARQVEETVNKATSHMLFDFKSELNPQYLVDIIASYVTLRGKFPEFIVVDNLKNFQIDDSITDEFAAAEQSLVFLNEIAHVTGAAVIALHHVTGEYESADTAIPLSGIRGKLSKTPSAIYTIFKPEDGRLMVSTVKNRGGQADPRGQMMFPIETNYSRGYIN